MSFLDELKQEAAATTAKEAEEKAATDVQRDAALKALEPTMKRLFEYLHELAKQLNIVGPNILSSYDVPGFGPLKDLRQGDYQVVMEGQEFYQIFSLQYVCSRPDVLLAEQPGKAPNQHERDEILRYGLRFKFKPSVHGNGTYDLKGYVPVSFEFSSVPEKNAIRLEVRNLDRVGINTFMFSPEAINTELMEELAKRVAQKANQFNELCGNKVPEETRMQFRQKLEERKKEREQELRGGGGQKGLFKGLFGKK